MLVEGLAQAPACLRPLAGVTARITSICPLAFTPAGRPIERILAGHLSLTWHLPWPRYHTGSLADSRLVSLWRYRDRHRDLHRLRRPRLHRQASEEFEDLSDGHAQLLALLLAGPACNLHLLPETIEVPPKLGDLLVVLVLSRLSFPESLPELAEPRLDPS